MVDTWVMFQLQSLLIHTQCEWFPWGRNCKTFLWVNLSASNSRFLPRRGGSLSPGLTSEVISTRLSKMLLVRHLQFLHQPFRQISLGVPEQMGKFVWWSWSVIHTVGTSDPGLCQAQITQGWDCLHWGHSWNILVYPDQGLALDQPFMQYFLLVGNRECFVYIILNCTQTMCPLLLLL